MTKASGSIDLKSLKVAGANATGYITSIDNDNGIQIHATNNVNLNYTQITSDGMEIFKTNGAESNPSAISVAKFGESIRIGKGNEGLMTITDSSITGQGRTGKNFFVFGDSETSAPTQFRQLFVEMLPDYEMPVTEEEGLTYTLSQQPLADTWVYFYIQTYDNNYRKNLCPHFAFQKGVPRSSSYPVLIGGIYHRIHVTYDGDMSFTNIYTETVTNIGAFDCYADYTMYGLCPSYVLGGNTTATGAYAFATGYNTHADGNYSAGFGKNNVPLGYCQFVIGEDASTNGSTKASRVDTDHVFVIGNGTTNTSSNAMTVDWNGIVNAGNIHQIMTACVSAVVKNLTDSGKKMTLESAVNCSDYLSLDNGGIKCAKAGYVLVSAEVQFYGVNDNNVCNLAIYRGSSTVALSASRSANDRTEVVVAPKLISVSANDTLYLYVSNTSTDVGQAGATSSSVTSTDKIKNYLTVMYV